MRYGVVEMRCRLSVMLPLNRLTWSEGFPKYKNSSAGQQTTEKVFEIDRGTNLSDLPMTKNNTYKRMERWENQ